MPAATPRVAHIGPRRSSRLRPLGRLRPLRSLVLSLVIWLQACSASPPADSSPSSTAASERPITSPSASPLPAPTPAPAPRETPQAIALLDPQGRSTQPARAPAGGVAVVVFITSDCPIANSYAPALTWLNTRYQGRPVSLALVHTDPQITPELAATHAEEYGISATVLLDPRHRLVDSLDARVTPEAFVLNERGDVVYRGRIDDRVTGLGNRRQEASRHDLRDAIDAALAGRPIAEPQTRAWGCIITRINQP